jgi:hypothetical protein
MSLAAVGSAARPKEEEEIVVNWPLICAAGAAAAAVLALMAGAIVWLSHTARPQTPAAPAVIATTPKKIRKPVLPTKPMPGVAKHMAAPAAQVSSAAAPPREESKAARQQPSVPPVKKPVAKQVAVVKKPAPSKAAPSTKVIEEKASAPEFFPIKRRDFRYESELLELLAANSHELDLDAVEGTTKELLNKAKNSRHGTTPTPTDKDAQGVQSPTLELLARRTDLAGLPLRRGPECQLEKAAAQRLTEVSRKLCRAFLEIERTKHRSRGYDYMSLNRAEEAFLTHLGGSGSLPSAIGVLVQVLQVGGTDYRIALTHMLSTVKDPAASAALGQRALFDPSPDVRELAVLALRERPREEYRQTLLKGLRYPWSPVADHAAEALAALQDRAAVPQLVKLLDSPDPCAPRYDQDKRLVVSELVRVNHLRNCLMCHDSSTAQDDPVRGLVPEPGKPIRQAYYESRRGDFVRADVTYLRQDFSVAHEVKDHGAWPALQRFDYFIRQRPLSAEETKAYEKQKRSARPACPPNYPQRDAVLFALEGITSINGGATAEAWRSALTEIAAKSPSETSHPAPAPKQKP